MDNSKLFTRNMTQLKTKIKIVVFYSSEKDKNSLNNLRNACNTSKCEYTLIPIYMKLNGNTIEPTDLARQIKFKGFKNGLDKVCIIISPAIVSDKYITFKSLAAFETWLKP